MSTKSYSIAPDRRGLRGRQDKETKNDGSTLGSAIVFANLPRHIEASANSRALMPSVHFEPGCRIARGERTR
jgi:hypothetical protein